jgi:alpha-1,2-glucosyltransferase
MRRLHVGRLEKFTLLPIALLLLTLIFAVQWEVNSIVPNPYMDEPFHIGQTKKYCQGQWTEWDHNITTFPGLYLVAVGYVKLMDAFTHFFGFSQPISTFCDVGGLRSLNAILPPLILITAYIASKKLSILVGARDDENFVDNLLTALFVTFFPVSFFFTFLYYTDTLSVLTTLLMICCALSAHSSRHQRRWQFTLLLSSALSGALAVFVRQTNVIWVLFTLGMSIFFDFRHYRTVSIDKKAESSSQTQTPTSQRLSSNDDRLRDTNELLSFLCYLYTHCSEILRCYFLFFVIFVIFGVFVIWNGSITVGDKEAHTAILHIPQFFYCITFIAFWDFDIWWEFLWDIVPNFVASSQQIKRKLSVKKCVTSILLLLATLTLVEVTVYRFTYAHRYLLSDNRHYTFYLWRRLFVAYPNAKYFAAPIYLVIFFALWRHFRMCFPSTSSVFVINKVELIFSILR